MLRPTSRAYGLLSSLTVTLAAAGACTDDGSGVDPVGDAGGTGGDGGVGGSAGNGGSGGTTTTSAGGSAGEGGMPAGGAAGAGGVDRSVFRPERAPFTDARLEGLEVAPGFAINVYAEGMQHARMLAVHGGHVYLTRPMQGDVVRFVDEDSDGVAEANVSVASDLPLVHGIAFHDTQVFLATDKQVYRADVDAAGDFTTPEAIGEELPDGGQHPYRTLGVDPNEMLFISVGSTCDACEEPNPEHATILQAPLDGSSREIFATGLRNTIGFDWHPETDQLWGMDHGSDWRGDDLPPEELNRIEAGNDYGWPYCYGDQNIDPVIHDPPQSTKEAYCAMTTGSVQQYQAHGAPIGMVFYDGDSFPEEYTGDAFIALHGSWNRFPPTGYKVVRLHFADGQPGEFEDFVSGFLIEDGSQQFGRPAGIAVAPDGSLLFTDDENGMVYRVSYEE